jgi:hypothetical protein
MMKVKANSSNGDLVQYANLADGELVHLVPVETPSRVRQRYAYPGGYFTMSLIDVKRLIDLRLPVDGYRLALLVATQASLATGLVHCSNKEYAEQLGLRPRRISDLFAFLKRHSLVKRLSARTILVNPRWCFRGTPEQQRAAIEEWAEFHPLAVVKSYNRKMA